MKNILKTVGGIITFALIILSINFWGRLVRPTETDSAFWTINTFHDLPEDSIEIIIYGSSIAWRGMNVMEMYENYGIAAYNYGCNWQNINTTLLFVQDSLRTQSPKVIAIETTQVNTIFKDRDMDGQIYYTKAIGESLEKYKFLKGCFGNDIERWVSYYMPICAFHDNWINLNRDSFTNYDDKATTSTFYNTMGFMSLDWVNPIELRDWKTFPQFELDENVVCILDELVRTCKKNDIDIIFYTAPAAPEYYYFDAMKSYAAENECVYINFYEKIEEIGIDGQTDFSDEGHLNENGATKLADYLGRFIVANYEVTDMRQYEGNPWQAALDME